jgi:hypothetical protein
MNVTIIYGPAASGKTLVAEGLRHGLNLPAWGTAQLLTYVEDWPYPDTLKPALKEFKAAIRKAKNNGYGNLILVACAKPDDEVLALADFVVETRRNG